MPYPSTTISAAAMGGICPETTRMPEQRMSVAAVGNALAASFDPKMVRGEAGSVAMIHAPRPSMDTEQAAVGLMVAKKANAQGTRIMMWSNAAATS